MIIWFTKEKNKTKHVVLEGHSVWFGFMTLILVGNLILNIFTLTHTYIYIYIYIIYVSY